MSLCPYCGNENPDANNFCSSCGAKLMRVPAKPETENEPMDAPEETTVYEPTQTSEETTVYESAPTSEEAADHGADYESESASTETEAGPAFESGVTEQQPVYPQTDTSYYGGGQQPPEKIPIGGYVAWAIANILFCTIPGAIGLFFVLKINKAATQEEQLKAMDTAKKALIIGSVLAALNLLSQIVVNM